MGRCYTDLKSLTANRKLLKANPPLTSVTGDRHGVQCANGAFLPEMCYETMRNKAMVIWRGIAHELCLGI
uniref:SFRICE_002243 n=1 Tax=Spodoptera frugiperda TaxID=7108 RepID=A0A2H1VWS2_SPOFR